MTRLSNHVVMPIQLSAYQTRPYCTIPHSWPVSYHAIILSHLVAFFQAMDVEPNDPLLCVPPVAACVAAAGVNEKLVNARRCKKSVQKSRASDASNTGAATDASSATSSRIDVAGFKNKTLTVLRSSMFWQGCCRSFHSFTYDNAAPCHHLAVSITYLRPTRTAQAKIQVASAFLPGRVCESHVALVARKIVALIGSVTAETGVVSRPIATLTSKLGEACLLFACQFLFHFSCC